MLGVQQIGSAPESVRVAEKVLFEGIRTQLNAEANFGTLADATIEAAKKISPDVANQVVHAWYAVNVWENFWEGRQVGLSPARDQENVYPWTTFSWQAFADETSWDFQLTQGTFDPATSPIIIEERNVGTRTARGGIQLGEFQFALIAEATSRFFWRVRPHSDAPWPVDDDCYPIHSFVRTGKPGTVKNIRVAKELTPENKVRPGLATFTFDRVEGAQGYRAFVSTRKGVCAAGEGVLEAQPSTPSTAMVQAVDVSALQPTTHYFIAVQPVGPKGFNDLDSMGKCSELEFDTSTMRAPTPTYGILGSDTGGLQNIHGTGSGAPRISWHSVDSAAKFKVNFYEMIDNAGTCDSSVARSEVLDSACRVCADCAPECDTKLQPLPFASNPNPPGYCWEVSSMASNGSPSEPSARVRFHYFHPAVKLLGPGVEWPLTEDQFRLGNLTFEPATLDLAFGNDVTLSWQDDVDGALEYGIVHYGVRAGAWPLGRNEPPRSPPLYPVNCISGGHVLCGGEPSKTYFEQAEVPGTTVLAPGLLVNRGRNCWWVWPVFGDLKTGQRSLRQPSVIPAHLCYTSQPSVPKIQHKFEWGKPITGYINVEFLPNPPMGVAYHVDGPGADVSQVKVDGPPTFSDGTPCIPFPFPGTDAQVWSGFLDLHNCRNNFTIEGHTGTTYTMTANVWGSGADKATAPPFHTATKDIKIPFPCGSEGFRCCPATEPCNASGLACAFGEDPPMCARCGDTGQSCCGGNLCSPGLDCQSGKCECAAFTLPPPSLGEISNFQRFCTTPTGTCTSFDEICLSDCAISGGTIQDLVNNGTIPCSRELAIIWKGPTKDYRVYWSRFGSGQVQSRDVAQTLFRTEVPVTPDASLYSIVVRPQDKCGKLGPPAAGMLAVTSRCDVFGNIPPP